MKKLVAIVALIVGISPSLLVAEDLDALLKNVTKYVSEKNYPKALEELGWARQEIDNLHMEKIKEFLPKTVGELQGDEMEANSALGIMTLKREYKGGDLELTATLTGGAPGSQAAQGLGQFAQMAAMMGGVAGQGETFRIDGKTATITSEKGADRTELRIILSSGSTLELALNKSDSQKLKDLAKAFNVGTLDKYLKGEATS